MPKYRALYLHPGTRRQLSSASVICRDDAGFSTLFPPYLPAVGSDSTLAASRQWLVLPRSMWRQLKSVSPPAPQGNGPTGYSIGPAIGIPPVLAARNSCSISLFSACIAFALTSRVFDLVKRVYPTKPFDTPFQLAFCCLSLIDALLNLFASFFTLTRTIIFFDGSSFQRGTSLHPVFRTFPAGRDTRARLIYMTLGCSGRANRLISSPSESP